MARTLKAATLVEIDGTPADVKAKFDAHEIDAFGANRQRLTNIMKELPGYRLLPDNIFDVPQTIIVGKGNAQGLATVNALIDDVRQSGFLKSCAREERHPRHRRRAVGLWLRKGRVDAGLLLRAGNELDGAAHRAARDRRAVRGAAAFVCHQRAARSAVPRDQPGRKGAGARDRRPAADRGRGDPVLSREAISRSRAAAEGRYRGRSASDLVDVVHRLDRASRAAAGPRARERTIYRLADERLGGANGRSAATRSPTSTCSACTGASSIR